MSILKRQIPTILMKLKSTFTRDAIYFFSNKTCTTHDDIQDYFENAWEVVKDENYEAHDVQWLFVSETSYDLYLYIFL